MLTVQKTGKKLKSIATTHGLSCVLCDGLFVGIGFCILFPVIPVEKKRKFGSSRREYSRKKLQCGFC